MAHESATGTKRFAANGQYSFLIKSGRTTVTVAPLTFAVGGLQPADLVPRLGILEAVSGGIAAEMSAYFGPDSLKTFGNVRASGLSFSVAGTTVRNVNTNFDLASLTPPATDLPQSLTIAAVDSATSVTDIEALLSLRSTEPPNTTSVPLVVIERAKALAAIYRWLTLRSGPARNSSNSLLR